MQTILKEQMENSNNYRLVLEAEVDELRKKLRCSEQRNLLLSKTKVEEQPHEINSWSISLDVKGAEGDSLDNPCTIIQTIEEPDDHFERIPIRNNLSINSPHAKQSVSPFQDPISEPPDRSYFESFVEYVELPAMSFRNINIEFFLMGLCVIFFILSSMVRGMPKNIGRTYSSPITQ